MHDFFFFFLRIIYIRILLVISCVIKIFHNYISCFSNPNLHGRNNGSWDILKIIKNVCLNLFISALLSIFFSTSEFISSLEFKL